MPYGKCEILLEQTKELGTDLETITKGSRNKIVIRCQDCKVQIIREFKGFKGIHKCKTIIDGKKKCFKCGTKKDVDSFTKNRGSHDGYSKLCKECYSNYGSVKRWYKHKSTLIKQNIEKYFEHKYLNLKSRCIKMELEFDLERTTLYELYLKQDKKCYYSGLEMIHNINYCDYNSISIDKKDPTKGYTKDNIVLCAFCVNSFKGSKNEEEFKNLLKNIVKNLETYSAS